jgi:hypothetical protein
LAGGARIPVPGFKIPGRDAIGEHLLDKEYVAIQSEVVLELEKAVMICVTLDGATNKAGKQVLNMKAAVPTAYFVEHFQMDLLRESSNNLLLKLLASRSNLLVSLGRAEANADGVITEHRRDPDDYDAIIMFNFCTDSPRVMSALQCKALLTGKVFYAVGCSPHGLNNLCLDWVKIDSIKKVISRNVLTVVNINTIHLLLSMFDKLCKQKLGKTHALILFSKTSWGTVYANQRRNLQVGPDFDAALDRERRRLHRRRDGGRPEGSHPRSAPLEADSLGRKPAQTALFGDCPRRGRRGHVLVGPRLLPGCRPSCADHLRRHPAQNCRERAVEDLHLALAKHVQARYKTIYSPAHALAFATDRFFDDMRQRLARLHGASFINLVQGALNKQCLTGLTLAAVLADTVCKI